MRQNSKVEPSNQPSSATALHPVLSVALANLDIQLEDELVRYRRQRALTGRASSSLKRKQQSHQLDLIAVAATSDQNSVSEAAPTTLSALDERLTEVAAQPAIAPDAYKPIPAFTASPQPFEAAIALRAPSASLTQADGTVPLPAVEDKAHALAHAGTPNLDDYLESSEELLRSLADERAEVRAERNFMQSLITPLGLGSMLLLLLSSAMFGYVIMNPSSLGHLLVWRNGNADSSGLSPSGQTSGQSAMPPPQPNLAKRELPDLNLSNLGTLNVSPGSPTVSGTSKPTVSGTSKQSTAPVNSQASEATPAPTAPKTSQESPAPVGQAPVPAVTSSSSRPASVRTYEPPQAAAPSRATVAPSRPAPKTYNAPVLPATPRVIAPTTARSTSSNTYPIKVITHYDGDSALTKSRTVVPDAYLRNFPDGAKIQLGAYGDAAAAEAKAQELRSRGIPAEVYKP